MRWLLALALIAPAADGRDMEMPRPAPVRQCARASSWDGVEKCLKKLGKPMVLRVLPNARLVRVDMPDGNGGTTDIGMSLYVERDGGWRIGGNYEHRSQAYELLAAEPLVVGTHAGFRLDVGETTRSSVSIDDVRAEPALILLHRVLLCSGDNWGCTETAIACDVIVRGAVRWTFHGTLAIADNQVKVAGDRRFAGSMCTVAESQFLGWTQRQ